MLDIRMIRENAAEVQKKLAKRCQVDFSELLAWDHQRNSLRQEADSLKAHRTKESERVAQLKKEGKSVEEITLSMRQLGERIKQVDTEVTELENKIEGFLAALPNIPDDDVLPGGKENNEVVRVWGKKPEPAFKIKDHVELVSTLNLIDYERGVKLGGRGFWLYKGKGALLEWGLLNYFVEEHVKDGYEFILPPHLLNFQCGYTAGQFPKFVDDVFSINSESDNFRFLLPTAETALCNLYRDEILSDADLPVKLFSYTPCYRKEAGSYRTEERGMIRGHQFNKIEMFQYTLPELSPSAFEELLQKAERLLQGLGLHHRVSKLAAEDMGAGMARTYDVEVWIPSMGEFKEASSVSNVRDYQARRGNIRFKRTGAKKTEYVHTLNASGLATSRLLPAICEQFQQEDGSVVVPEVLRKWTQVDVLRPA